VNDDDDDDNDRFGTWSTSNTDGTTGYPDTRQTMMVHAVSSTTSLSKSVCLW